MFRFNYATVSVAGTSDVTSGPALLHTLSITDTTAGTITVKDGTAAAAATVGVWLGGTQQTFVLDEVFGSGIRVVTAGNIKANVSYETI